MKRFFHALSLATLLASSTALAQEEPDPSHSRATTFEAAEGPQGEDIPGGPLLVAAYGLAWLIIFAFVGTIALRQSRASNDLARLKKDIESRESKG